MLSDPAKVYPTYFSPTGIFARFPYLLPNLVCALMLLLSIVVVIFFMEETNASLQGCDITDEWEECPRKSADYQDALVRKVAGPTMYGTLEVTTSPTLVDSPIPVPGPLPVIIFTKKVVMLIVAFGIFTYHTMAYEHLLPIFLQDSPSTVMISMNRPSPPSIPGGLNLSTNSVGVILSINGVSAIIVQGLLFPFLASHFGVFRLFIICTILHPTSYILPPFLTFLPEHLLYTGIYSCLTIQNLFAIMQYPLLLILLKESCSDLRFLGSVNGMAASFGAGARTLGPPIGGYLYDYSKRVECVGIAWWATGLVAVGGAIQLLWVKQSKMDKVLVGSLPDDCMEDVDYYRVRERIPHKEIEV
jgi:hypothetical protein